MEFLKKHAISGRASQLLLLQVAVLHRRFISPVNSLVPISTSGWVRKGTVKVKLLVRIKARTEHQVLKLGNG